MKDISLFGFPGVGKGTQAKKILEQYNETYCYFEAGNILRALSTNNNILGEYIKKNMNKGYMVDDSFILSLFDAYLVVLERHHNLLLDAFPRKMGQMYLLMDRLKRINREFMGIYLELSEEEIVRRLSARRICENCGSTYNLLIHERMEKCSECNGILVKRKDDEEEVIKKRIKVYQEETMPVIEYLSERGLLRRVDSSLPPDELFKKITGIIEE